jgi:hypothetical protein
MIAFVARIAIVVMSLGSQVEFAVADGPPKLNVGPSCDAAARGAISLGRNAAACMGDERDAQVQLTNNWSQYSRAHKTQCVGMTTRGGPSSYVELISCRDIMRDAAAIYKADPLFGDFGKNPKENPPNQPSNRLAAGRGAERTMKRLPSCSISVSVSESRSAMISGQEPDRLNAAMRSSSAFFSTRARKLQNTWPRMVCPSASAKSTGYVMHQGSNCRRWV